MEQSSHHHGPGSRGWKALLSLLPQLLVAGILVQTLFFKFTGAEESIYIFQTLGVEPWGRIGSGVVEMIAAMLILIPRTVALGAILALATMVGAVGAHLSRLGVVVKEDGGLLFGLALTVLTGSLALLIIHGRQIPWLGRRPGTVGNHPSRIPA